MLAYAFYDNDCRILQYTQALRARGHSVDVIALRREAQARFSVVDGVKVYRIQGRTRNESGRLAYVTRILRFFVHSAFFWHVSIWPTAMTWFMCIRCRTSWSSRQSSPS